MEVWSCGSVCFISIQSGFGLVPTVIFVSMWTHAKKTS